MSTRSTSLRAKPSNPSRAKSRGRSGRRSTRRQAWRRRAALLVAAALAGLLVFAAISPFLDKAVQEISLPLRHEDIIRQQAADKNLDPALIAGVIYTESRFRDQTSPAGAKGLMQILPSTADYIARKSGGTAFEQGDLASPQINIAYGSYFLRYLIDHYDGHEPLAIAAYNAGLGNVDEWVAEAGGSEDFDLDVDIPFPETRAYVRNVLERRSEYREHYADELGL